MEPCDAVKLVYQSVLGGGHLITDPARSLERLAEEYAAVPQTVGPLYEALGNGVVRVHLSRLDAWGVGLEALNSWFVRSAEVCPGTRKALEASLWELIRAAEARLLPFSPAALAEYLRGYPGGGLPAGVPLGGLPGGLSPSLSGGAAQPAARGTPHLRHIDQFPGTRLPLRALCVYWGSSMTQLRSSYQW